MTDDRYQTARHWTDRALLLVVMIALLWLTLHVVTACEPTQTPADAPPPVAITGADIGGRAVVSSPVGEVEIDLDAGTTSADGWAVVEWEARGEVELSISGSAHTIGVERMADGCTMARYAGLVALSAQVRGCVQASGIATE